MPFNAILDALTDRCRAAGAVLIDEEGEVVASHAAATAPPAKKLDMPLVGAHQGIVLDRVREAASRSLRDAGPVLSTLITTAEASVVISTVKEGLSLVVVTGPDAAAGKVLFESKKAVKLIESEIG